MTIPSNIYLIFFIYNVIIFFSQKQQINEHGHTLFRKVSFAPSSSDHEENDSVSYGSMDSHSSGNVPDDSLLYGIEGLSFNFEYDELGDSKNIISEINSTLLSDAAEIIGDMQETQNDSNLHNQSQPGPDIDASSSSKRELQLFPKPSLNPYLSSEDDSDSGALELSMIQNFASEHRIFLRAILSLLIERDQFAVDAASADDPQTIKAGPLKKASHIVKGVWKVRYVEIRRGLFSYYDVSGERGKHDRNSSGSFNLEGTISGDVIADNGALLAITGNKKKNLSLQRKSLPLQADLCTCRAVKMHSDSKSSSPRLPFQSGYIFELTVKGGPKRLWMANSREERQAWIQAIHNAMIGGSVTRGKSYVDYNGVEGDLGIPPNSPHKSDLEMYISVQREIQQAQSDHEYIVALQCLFGRKLQVPVQWIKGQLDDDHTKRVKSSRFEEGHMSLVIDQLWKDMLRDSVDINGNIIKGDEGHGPERIIGAVVRSILLYDKLAIDEQYRETQKKSKRRKKRKPVKEYKAVTIARDVLLSADRTRSGGDSYYCVEKLCENHDLVALCPLSSEAEPLKITISLTDLSVRPSTNKKKDCRGWIKIRNKITKRWKKRFCVLGEGGVLSYYEKEKPRPHGLRAQIIMLHAKMEFFKVNRGKYIVSIVTRDRSSERQFCFDRKKDFLVWKESFQKAINGIVATTVESNDDIDTLLPQSKSIDEPNLEGEKVSSVAVNIKGDTHLSDSSDHIFGNTDTSDIEKKEKKSDLSTHEKNGDQPSKNTPGISMKKRNGGRRSNRSSVYINIQASTAYKICTKDPDGIEEDDTWA